MYSFLQCVTVTLLCELRSAAAVMQCTNVVSTSSSFDAAAAVDASGGAAAAVTVEGDGEEEGLWPRIRRSQGC